MNPKLDRFAQRPGNRGLTKEDLMRRFLIEEREREEMEFWMRGLSEAQSREGSISSSSAAGGGPKSPDIPTDPYQRLLYQANLLGYSVPSPSQQIIQQNLITDLQDIGAWDLLDVFYMFANNGSAEFTTLNWKDATKNQATLVNSPVWTSNVGFSLSSGLFRTGYTPSNDAVNFQLNSAGVFWKLETVGSVSNARWFGSGQGGSAPLRFRTPSGVYFNTNGSISAGVIPVTNELYSFYRVDGTFIKIYRDNSGTQFINSPTSSLMSFPLELPVTPAAATASCLGIGGNLESLQSSLVTLFQNYMSSL